MTAEQLTAALAALDKEHRASVLKLQKQYANANNPYKIGDIITDHIGSLKIESISYAHKFQSDQLQCVYNGQRLTKNGKPHKKETTPVFQTNIKPQTT